MRSEAFECIGEAGLERVRKATDGWMSAKVPGEIHLDLMRAGEMPDPSVGANMPECRWPETKSWWYRTMFTLDQDFLRHERQRLVFDGLDLNAQVFVNGAIAGESTDAFVPAEFDVRRLLRSGDNELVVRLTAGSELAVDDTPPGQGKAERRPSAAAGGKIPNPMREGDMYGHRIWPGKKWLRKPQFMYGWDWVDALPNIGIWRGVRLEGRTFAVIQDLRLDTVLEDDHVFLEMEAVVENLHPWSERSCTLELEITPPDGGKTHKSRYPMAVPPGRMPVRDLLEVPKPKLWWPNGMGEQPLYRVTATLTDGRMSVCDRRQFSIGLRTVEIDRSPLPEGSRFCVRVNGEDIFCRGGNIGPHDAIPARIPDEKYRNLVAEAKNAGMTMIRINGCSFYEAPAFYTACDQAGILVWQDFMLTCTTYPDDDERFCSLVSSETEMVVRMLRHHPSIALWCGNNECTWGFRDWWNPDKTKPLELGGQKLYSRILPDICQRLDPHRPYWPSSPCGGEDPNSELAGDCHWWHPFFMNPDMDRRIRHEVFDECRARFASEYGVIGPCHLDSISEYQASDEMQQGTAAWQMHTNTFEKETLQAAIRLHYADPEGLTAPEYVLYGQMFQAVIHGHAMEALRFRKGDPVDDCQGALIWSYSDCWGETGWSVLDYYLRRKASYYWVRRACAPLKVIVRRRKGRLVTRIVNDTLQPAVGSVDYGWWKLDGRSRDTESRTVRVPANGMIEVASTSADDTKDRNPRLWLYAAVLRREDGMPVDQSVWPLLPHRELALDSKEIAAKKLAEDWLEISSPGFCHGVHVEDHGREVISDNWFDLLPEIPVRVRLCTDASTDELRFEALRVLHRG